MIGTSERAYLVIADVSGYTGYLAGSELDHAHDVLADLLETVIGSLGAGLRLAKLEGDAVFVYAPEAEVNPSMLLDTLEACYFAFRRRLHSIRQGTTCPCNACRLIPNLNLKFCVHHGNLVRQRIAGREELAGSDVILVHRLLKNSVWETLGLNAYALLTEASVKALAIDPIVLGMTLTREHYEHFGEILLYVHNLEARWEDERKARRVVIEPEDADVLLEFLLPGPPSLVWDFLTEPVKRVLWMDGVTRVDQFTEGGRRGTGTTNHCMHGAEAYLEEILDWHPFEYFTDRTEVPGFGPITMTTRLAPDGAGTRLTSHWRFGTDEQRATWSQMREEFLPMFTQMYGHLGKVLAEELEAHKEDAETARAARAHLQEVAARSREIRQATAQPNGSDDVESIVGLP